MPFRTHVGRSLDFSYPSNRLIALLTLAALVAGGAIALSGGPRGAWLAPVNTFLVWALVRELDPDHDSTAIVAAVAAAAWVLLGQDPSAWLFVGGMVLAARLVLNSTGRRPLVSDFYWVAAASILIALFSPSAEGWVAGFGIAIALYVDDRLAAQHNIRAVVAAVIAAVGASAAALLTGVFPLSVVAIEPMAVLGYGLLGLLVVVRDPLPPTSTVDAKTQLPMEQGRLHAARALVGGLIFIAALFVARRAVALVPPAIGLGLALVADQVARIRQAR
ncbi:MAG: hypothetical protein ACE5F5_06410 [Acidimicrobiia bacterium]